MEPIDPDRLASDVYRGPFHERQRALGAAFYEDMGCLWTANFGDPAAEYEAVLRGVGVWDESALITYHVTGPDALRALERLTTRAITRLPVGRAAYGVILREDGRMLDEVTVFPCSATEAYLFGNDERPAFVEHVARVCAALGATVDNVTRTMPTLSIQGPGSAVALGSLVDADLARLRWFDHFAEPVRVAGRRAIVGRVCFTGELGYEVHVLDDAALDLWDAVTGAGAVPIGIDAVELLRVEAGLLIQDEDYRPGETDPYELGLGRFIDLESGHAFVGREACVRTAAAPARRLVTLVFEDGVAPPPGARITMNDRDVGDVRSPQVTPRFGPIALAVVEAAASADGTPVIVGGIAGVVRAVPIDPASRARRTADVRAGRAGSRAASG
jgi:aminomethyltransferase